MVLTKNISENGEDTTENDHDYPEADVNGENEECGNDDPENDKANDSTDASRHFFTSF